MQPHQRTNRILCFIYFNVITQTTAFHPQSDGLVERFNRTIEDMLSKAVRRDQRNWDEILLLLMLAYCNHAREPIGYCVLFILMSYCLFCRSRTNAIWLDASLLILKHTKSKIVHHDRLKAYFGEPETYKTVLYYLRNLLTNNNTYELLI
jgi:hypothetical protein